MRTCLECGRTLFAIEADGACFPCTWHSTRRLYDVVMRLGQIARPGAKYFNELHGNIDNAFKERCDGEQAQG